MELVEYSCFDEHICDCICLNMDCVHNKRKEFENYDGKYDLKRNKREERYGCIGADFTSTE